MELNLSTKSTRVGANMKKKRLRDRKLTENGHFLAGSEGRPVMTLAQQDTYQMTHAPYGMRLAAGFAMIRKGGD
jgi:hypothetical protein